MIRIAIFITVLGLMPALAAGSLVVSTNMGGLWTAGSTWVGGAVPGPGDDVLIAGPVQVPGAQSCASLLVNSMGLVRGANSGPSSLAVAGPVLNQGQIQNGPFPFTLALGGYLTNAGNWTNQQTRLTGAAERRLHTEAASVFTSALVFAAGATGDLIVETPFRKSGDLDVTGGRLILEPDCPLTVHEGRISGELICNGNELRVESWSYLDAASLDAVVLVGEVEIAGASFTGGLTVRDGLRTLPASGGAHAFISGGLVNEGLISNNSYGFTIDLSGDLVNNGIINNSWVQLDALSVHHLSMGPEGLFDASMFLPEFQGGTIIADTPLRFSDGLSLAGGTMILMPGADLTFFLWGALTSGTLLANGNTIRLNGQGSLGDLQVDAGVLAGEVQIAYDSQFTGGLTVADTLQNWQFYSPEITVSDLLVNDGLIRDKVQDFAIRVLGSLQNNGDWQNARVTLAGSEDQAVGAGPGIAVPQFVLESGLNGPSYQWYRDGQPLPGETGAKLTLAGVDVMDYGLYRCETGGGAVSRAIMIDRFADPTAAPPLAAPARLAQNHPNPFNPATEIDFSLAAAGPVRLSVHDAAGREVAVLVDRTLAAGEHSVTWQPEGLASGVYLYRLRAGGTERLGKCTLLK